MTASILVMLTSERYSRKSIGVGECMHTYAHVHTHRLEIWSVTQEPKNDQIIEGGWKRSKMDEMED